LHPAGIDAVDRVPVHIGIAVEGLQRVAAGEAAQARAVHPRAQMYSLDVLETVEAVVCHLLVKLYCVSKKCAKLSQSVTSKTRQLSPNLV
jgi:hypothetical protein